MYCKYTVVRALPFFCPPPKSKIPGQFGKGITHLNTRDEFEVKTEARKWVIKVTGLLYTRVQYSEAVNFYIDITPAEELDRIKFEAAVFHTGKRQSKIGRPTKRERRDLGGYMDI